MSTPKSLGDWLRAAYEGSPECPPESSFALVAGEEASNEELTQLRAHARNCARCYAELELALLFEAESAERLNPDHFAARRIIALGQSGQSPGETAASGEGSRFGASWYQRPVWQWLAAAAVVMALATSVPTLRLQSGQLPDPLAGDTRRSGLIEILSPRGTVVGPIHQLKWRAKEGSARYLIQLIAVDDAVLWTETTVSGQIEVTGELARRLRPAVNYRWSVTALGVDDEEIARSRLTPFRIRPPSSNL